MLSLTGFISRRFGLVGGLAIVGALAATEGVEIVKGLTDTGPQPGSGETITTASGLQYVDILVGTSGDSPTPGNIVGFNAGGSQKTPHHPTTPPPHHPSTPPPRHPATPPPRHPVTPPSHHPNNPPTHYPCRPIAPMSVVTIGDVTLFDTYKDKPVVSCLPAVLTILLHVPALQRSAQHNAPNIKSRSQ